METETFIRLFNRLDISNIAYMRIRQIALNPLCYRPYNHADLYRLEDYII